VRVDGLEIGFHRLCCTTSGVYSDAVSGDAATRGWAPTYDMQYWMQSIHFDLAVVLVCGFHMTIGRPAKVLSQHLSQPAVLGR